MQPFQRYIAPAVFVLPIYLAICKTLELDTRVLVPNVNVSETDLDVQEQRWKCMKVCQQALNAQKSKQLYRLASLVEKYPHMLKKHLDPGVTARPNSQHIIKYLRSCAEHVKKEWYFRSETVLGTGTLLEAEIVHKPQVRCAALFRSEGLPFVPVQKYWKLFLTQLRANPPQLDGSESQSLIKGLKEFTKTWDTHGLLEKIKGIGLAQPSHTYPEDVRQDYITAIKGTSERRRFRCNESYDAGFSQEQKRSAREYGFEQYKRGTSRYKVWTPEMLGYRKSLKYLPHRL
ncbi:hypothetical protein MMC18_003100 [Xylographa bjoerkii]|nr:hypothetical protein [Xylographa bjoerkii]